MKFIQTLKAACIALCRILGVSRSKDIQKAEEVIPAPVHTPESAPESVPVSAMPKCVGPVPVPASDQHQLPADVQAERDRFIHQLMNPQQGTEATEQTLAAGSNIVQAVSVLRRCFPPLVVRPDTSMTEIQHSAGQQSVIDALERLHLRGKC